MRHLRRAASGTGTDLAVPDAPRRYRTIIGTREDLTCADWGEFPTTHCGEPATRIFLGGGAVPMCEAHWQEALPHLDSGSGCVARRDETGLWRPTGQFGEDQAAPYDFDW